ncbi:SPOR domain-containing protein [Dyadobacter psychrophilus]|uniref:Sporulation related domain-containing protein n=1 Tax=Dyadobacter psychrophilus TaxID=651661 RepID=A0A1T5H967_9BACT|nr:SPOR domain-containing protein [Dyadobacter psychrophilus]SKC17245.1 Sporulation related domain-containing protein [Dyadobacter psychrophilus]
MVIHPFLIKFVGSVITTKDMMLKKNFLWALHLFIIILSGCSKKSVVSSSGSEYKEDLSSVRPRFEYVEPTVTEKAAPVSTPKTSTAQKGNVDKPLYVNKRLETVLDTLAKHNKSIRYANGFRIQIYVGNVRQEADDAKSYIYQAFPDLNPYVSYTQPTYRVKVGDFMYRTDAEQYLELIRERYSSAVILADRVDIKRSLLVNPTAESN